MSWVNFLDWIYPGWRKLCSYKSPEELAMERAEAARQEAEAARIRQAEIAAALALVKGEDLGEDLEAVFQEGGKELVYYLIDQRKATPCPDFAQFDREFRVEGNKVKLYKNAPVKDDDNGIIIESDIWAHPMYFSFDMIDYFVDEFARLYQKPTLRRANNKFFTFYNLRDNN